MSAEGEIYMRTLNYYQQGQYKGISLYTYVMWTMVTYVSHTLV